MTAIESDMEPLREKPSQEVLDIQERRLQRAWHGPTGWRYWSEVNNGVVGLWYTLTSFAFFAFGGILALLMRLQLAIPENDLLTGEQYNQIFTMHGSVMMFLFAVPILEAISILLLPSMMGARDLPFPRLSAYGYWCFLIGGVFVCSSIFFGASPRGGWFMYPPLTTKYQTDIGADIWLLGLSFIEIASIAAAVELIVGVLKCRPPGMRLNLIPLYSWYILVVGAMILFAFPPLIAGDILLELERALDWPFFDASRGGDPLLWQHLFWIFGHPEVYIVFLPSIALVAMMIPTFAQTSMVGHGWIVLAAVGTGFLSFGLWVHHMFTTGLPGITVGFFSAASEAVAIPTGVQLFCFIATLMAGRVRLTACMWFVLGGLASFVIGGLTGVMIAIAPFDFQVHDTYFIVGHLHYVLIGGAIFPILAAVYYYHPLITGRMLSERIGIASFGVILVGFNLTFFPMHMTGMIGMPRRVYTYPSGLGLETVNLLSTIGSWILAIGLLIILWDLCFRTSKHLIAERNPWNAGTLEWTTPLPPTIRYGIRSIPEIDARYPVWDQPNLFRDVDEGRFFLPDAEEGKRETLVTTVLDARPLQCLRVGGPSFVPFWAAVFTGGAFIFSTYHWWWLAGWSGLMAIGTILYWTWTGTAVIPEKQKKSIGLGVELPLYVSGPSSVGWWAMFITMLGDSTAFASLIFAYLFYWTIHEDFPPDNAVGPGWILPFGAAILTIVAWLVVILARRANRRNHSVDFYTYLAIGGLAGVCGWICLLEALLLSRMDPTQHVYQASVWVLVLWALLHQAVGLLMIVYMAARRLTGRMTSLYDADAQNITLYWHFSTLTCLLTVLIIVGLPFLSPANAHSLVDPDIFPFSVESWS